MKQIWPNYSYSPATNVLTFTGLNIDRDQLLLVTAADRGRIMYNFADSSVTASAFTSGANTALTLVATTAGLTTTAALVIYYDDQVASNSVTGTVELGPTSLNALESITVTMGQVTVTGGLTDVQLRASAVTISGSVTASSTYQPSQLQWIKAGSSYLERVSESRWLGGQAGTDIIQITWNENDGWVLSGNIYTSGPYIGGDIDSRIPPVGVYTGQDSNTINVSYEQPSTQVVSGVVTANLGSALPSGINQIGSVTASISNSVVTFYPMQGTSVSSTTFTSLTASTTLVSAISGREVLTVFNEGAGNLHISGGATCTTISYQVRLSAGDYWECPAGQLSLAHAAVFATAGTARVTQVS